MKMNLEMWYGNSIRIPTYAQYGFGSFVASCLGIVKHILDRYVGVEVHVRFSSHGTAAMDKKNGIIHINENYLVGFVHEGQKEPLPSSSAISLILGLTVHEGAHYAWSPDDMEEGIRYIKTRTTQPFVEKLAAAVVNIIEDVWIESEVDRKTPSLTWMLNEMNDIYFSPRISNDRWLKVKEVTEAPPLLEVIGDILNLLVLAKIRERFIEVTVDENTYIEKLFNLVRSAVDCTGDPKTRFELSLDLYDQLTRNLLESECESPSGEESIEAALEIIMGSYEGGKSEHKIKALTEDTVERTLIAALEELERIAAFHISSEENDFDVGRVVYLEKTLKFQSQKVQLNETYMALAEMARQRASTNKPYGQDRNRGHHIRKLHRIATDQKIFAETVRMHDYKPLEVIILLDCSGSMKSGATMKQSRLDLALKAGYGAAVGLSEGRSRVAVYGHTADVFDKEVMIYNAKGFDDPISDLPHRLWDIYNNRQAQNKDGFAIRYVGGKFTSRQRRRLLIVISDGEPAAPAYHGDRAKEHTKECVDELRSRGIDVLSISITQEAAKANNFIYGRKWNVFNDDPNVIADIVRSLFE